MSWAPKSLGKSLWAGNLCGHKVNLKVYLSLPIHYSQFTFFHYISELQMMENWFKKELLLRVFDVLGGEKTTEQGKKFNKIVLNQTKIWWINWIKCKIIFYFGLFHVPATLRKNLVKTKDFFNWRRCSWAFQFILKRTIHFSNININI